VLQCVAVKRDLCDKRYRKIACVCCSVLQCGSVLQYVAVCCSEERPMCMTKDIARLRVCVTVCYSVLQCCVAVRSSVLRQDRNCVAHAQVFPLHTDDHDHVVSAR